MSTDKKQEEEQVEEKVDMKKNIRKALSIIAKTTTGSTAMMGDYEFEEVLRVPLPYLQVNHIMGGGYPRGRLVEIFGPESSGKSLLSAVIASCFQKQGLQVCWMDQERTMDVTFYKQFGLDTDEIIFSTPETAEDCIEVVKILARERAANLIIVDSVAALVSREEWDKTADQKSIATVPRIMSKELPKVCQMLADNDCSLLLINQVRDNVGVMYGPTETTPGGKAIKFFASMRIDLRRQGNSEIQNATTKEPIGHKINVKMVKNKTAAPNKKGEFLIYYDGREITLEDNMVDLFDILVSREVLDRDKNTYTYRTEGYEFSGVKSKFISEMTANEDLRVLLMNELSGKIKMGDEEKKKK